MRADCSQVLRRMPAQPKRSEWAGAASDPAPAASTVGAAGSDQHRGPGQQLMRQRGVGMGHQARARGSWLVAREGEPGSSGAQIWGHWPLIDGLGLGLT